MKFAWRLICLPAFVAMATLVYAMLSVAPPAEAARPILSLCVLFVLGWIVASIGRLISVKRFTTATGG